MPIRVVTGPPFSGKSQAVSKARSPGDIVLDTTLLWKAFRDPDDTERSDEDGRLSNAMKRSGLDVAVEQGRDGYVVLAERDPLRLRRWLEASEVSKAWLVSAPMDVLRGRARDRGPSCEALLEKWDGYEDDADFMELVEPWSEDEMRTIAEFEAQYRAGLEACQHREAGQLVQHRCLTEHAELRVAEGDNHRLVMGVAVRYDDEARVWGMRERILRGALELPKVANLTVQHDRSMPLGLLEWVDDDDALRFRCELTAGARQDQMIADVKAKLVRGASLEFIPTETAYTGKVTDPVAEIKAGRVLRLSLVDDGAYPKSKIELKLEPPAARMTPPVEPRASVPMLA